MTPEEIVVVPSDTWATDTNPHDWETLGRAFGRLIEQKGEMARPELDGMWKDTPAGKLDLFLRAIGKSREELERAIGRKVRLAADDVAHA